MSLRSVTSKTLRPVGTEATVDAVVVVAEDVVVYTLSGCEISAIMYRRRQLTVSLIQAWLVDHHHMRLTNLA